MKHLLAAAVVLALGSAEAASPDDPVELAISRGVSFLITQQGGDGGIHTAQPNRTTMTALAILALASVGHQPTDETREGRAMNRALAYVLNPANQDPNGYFGARDGSRMYGHGIITLMLGELLGMGVDAQQDKLLTERCRAAVNLILNSQAVAKDPMNRGGWRYLPESGDSDLSATIWQVMALRSAKNAGIEVPRPAIDQAVEYIKRCYFSPRDAQGRPTDLKSAFAYGNGRAPVYSTAAAGLLALPMCGQYEGQEVVSTADWLIGMKPDPNVQWFYYGTYYYAQGMYQRGGKYADVAKKNVEEILLSRQQPNGSWIPTLREAEVGPVYSTSLAILSLAVKYHFLQIYQR